MKQTWKTVAIVLILFLTGLSHALATPQQESTPAEGPAIDPQLDAWLREAQLGPYTADDEDWNEVVRRGEEEGRVVIYSTTSRIHRLKDLFESTYDIELEAYNIETLQLIEKFQREHDAGLYNADVILSDGIIEMYDMVQNGLMWKYVPERVADVVPPARQDWILEHRGGGAGLVIYYNEDWWPTPPDVTNLWEFTEEQWRGKIAMADPLQHGGTLNGLRDLVYGPNAEVMAEAYEQRYGRPIDLGEFANASYKFLADIFANNVLMLPSDDAVIDAAGAPNPPTQPPIGLFVTLSKIRNREERGLVITPFYGQIEPFEALGTPNTGVILGAPLGVAARARHPYAARVLIDFLMGDDEGFGGYEPWRANKPIRTDVNIPGPGGYDDDQFNRLPYGPDPDWIRNNRNDLADFLLTILL